MTKTKINATAALVSDAEVGAGISPFFPDAFVGNMEPGKAALARMRAELHRVLRLQLIALPGNQTEKARVLGIKQPRLNKLLNDGGEKFSLENLMVMASRVGVITSLKITAPRRSQEHQVAHG